VAGALRLATRGSPLALAQARIVADAFGRHGAGEVETVVIETAGDRRRDVPIHALGGQGVFVKEVEQAVLDGRADAAVHSAKDLPSALGPLALVAVLPRADPRDALVGRRLDALGPGARVATGSVRRRAQLAWLRPDLTFSELRGNMATRLDKVPDGGAVVVAMAALERLGLLERVAQVLDPAEMLPQVGQGAIAVCCRPDDTATALALSAIDDLDSSTALRAERAWLCEIGGGCEFPVGAHAVVSAAGELRLEALIASLDGHVVVRTSRAGSASGTGPEELGAGLAREMLSEHGGDALLERAGRLP
jgi:hydroxymethylbilane synthase